MSTLIQLGKVPDSPTKEQEIEMFERYFALPNGRDKDKQRNLIASHYLFFVHYIVHKRRYALKGIPYDDSYQQGFIGLIEGIDKFDLSKGCRFTSYVSFYIFRAVMREMKTNETEIKLPFNTYFKMKDPDYVEVCHGKEYYAPVYIKLDDVMGDTTHPLLDLFSSLDAEEDTCRAGNAHLHRKIVNNVLVNLKDVDLQIMQLYYGYQSDEKYTLSQIGQKLGLSAERIRQRRDNTIKRIRDSIIKLLNVEPENVTYLI